ncbi:MAG TPA: nucleotide exchange factor GrpE [Acidobacteriaceae bacterium]|nr:nucleotide exchange factor GrpE [Acidobacteriaceae bacterium]
MRHDETLKSAKTNHPKNDKEAPAAPASGSTPETEAATETAVETAAVPAEVERLQAERDQLFDRLARLQAEFDNYRKRETRERAEYRDYALINTVEQFLPVLDNFQLALKTDSTAEQLRSGVELIIRQMGEVLRSLGVQPIPTVDTQFDPRVHEAIEMVERDDLPDHQVMDEVRRGYTLRERLLRPALVRVATNPNQKTA